MVKVQIVGNSIENFGAHGIKIGQYNGPDIEIINNNIRNTPGCAIQIGDDDLMKLIKNLSPDKIIELSNIASEAEKNPYNEENLEKLKNFDARLINIISDSLAPAAKVASIGSFIINIIKLCHGS